MRAGKLRHRVTFLKPVAGNDDYSDLPTKQWVSATQHPIHAEIRQVSAKEVDAAGGKVVHTDLTVNIRYARALKMMDNHWRMEHDGMTFEVLAAFDPDQRKRQFTIHIRRQVI